jgi:hypothetical protein
MAINRQDQAATPISAQEPAEQSRAMFARDILVAGLAGLDKRGAGPLFQV